MLLQLRSVGDHEEQRDGAMVHMDFCIVDPSETFWDDPNMYVDDPGLDTLLSLTADELLLCNGQHATAAAEADSVRDRSPQNEQTDKTADGKHVLICMYPNCDKTYLKPSHLKVHMRRHSGEKPYRCVWPGCSWRFSRSDELSRHCRSHSGVKPYACDVCDKRFSRSDHLAKHSRVHHKRGSAAAANAYKPRRQRHPQLQQSHVIPATAAAAAAAAHEQRQ